MKSQRIELNCEGLAMNGSEDKGNGITGRLSSLWNTSTEKDDTCVTWGLVSMCAKNGCGHHSSPKFIIIMKLSRTEQKGENYWLLHLFTAGSALLWSGESSCDCYVNHLSPVPHVFTRH